MPKKLQLRHLVATNDRPVYIPDGDTAIFSPSQLGADLLSWVLPDKEGAVIYDGGGVVQTIADQGIGKGTLTPFGPATTYDEVSKTLVLTGGVLRYPTPFTLSGFTLLLVIADDTPAIGERWLGSTLPTQLSVGRSGYSPDVLTGSLFGGNLELVSPHTNAKKIVAFTLNGPQRLLSVNGGVNQASEQGGGGTLASLSISYGGNYDGSSAAQMRVYEGLFFTNSSQYARQVLEGYLAWKHGLQGQLPPAHPYKGAAPEYADLVDAANSALAPATDTDNSAFDI